MDVGWDLALPTGAHHTSACVAVGLHPQHTQTGYVFRDSSPESKGGGLVVFANKSKKRSGSFQLISWPSPVFTCHQKTTNCGFAISSYVDKAFIALASCDVSKTPNSATYLHKFNTM